METYEVGGCVRDELLGVKSKDVDYVVVGATPQQMLDMGYEQVGNDFPVFLHPITKDEYALARTERKTGAGYNGFDYEIANVTLEEDLSRRDLTINAMAKDSLGNIIDPYGGKKDLENKILRHVSIHFKEDPVRILRIARFSARYNFTIAPETIEFMKEMVDNGEFDSLTAERVWKEFEKVLPEKYLNNFFKVLTEIGALQKIPGFKNIQENEFFEFIREKTEDNHIIYSASLLHVFSQMSNESLKKWKMPAEQQHKISQFTNWRLESGFYSSMRNEDKVQFIQHNKALHGLDKPLELINIISLYQSWVNKSDYNFEWEASQFSKDITLLKNLDYPIIVKEALSNKIKPDQAVKEAQIQLLESAYKPKLKI